jgi:hypothetical protein
VLADHATNMETAAGRMGCDGKVMSGVAPGNALAHPNARCRTGEPRGKSGRPRKGVNSL